MSVVNLAATAASNRWVPREYFDTIWTTVPPLPVWAVVGVTLAKCGRVGDNCVVKPIIKSLEQASILISHYLGQTRLGG
jgi:hypothetical protein